MVGKDGKHVFRDERGACVDIVPKPTEYDSGRPTALHFVACLLQESSQPRKMPIRFAVAVLFVGLLSVAPLVWAVNAIQNEKGPATAAEHDAMDTCCWKTYTNDRYGFEMKYPQDFTVETGTPLAVIEEDVLRLLLVNRAYYNGTNLVEASVSVGVAPEKTCSSEWPNDGPPNSSERGSLAEKRDIAGVTFFRDSFWEGAVGHQYGLISYSASCGGSCYRLALFIHCISIHVFDPGTVFEFDRTAVLKLFDQVISTFQFVKLGS